ncbi:YjgN family protein [Glaciimonas soli]|uniref:YjgN family protein n=1 Tax=Glaciimonas soli TaxID=2590999 RepID=UPI002AD259FA|nr:YjgN family protein [Glaciimonas soli]
MNTVDPAAPSLNTAPDVSWPQLERFTFTGRGSEYFRIWIVNLLLSIVTLGIYSAWAKVRRTRYFYDNTHVAGASFEYHGNPKAILKGRVIALVGIIAYKVAFRVSPTVGFITFAVLAALFPWLIWKSYQFKLYNSSYRGIRFGFRGNLGQVYKTYLLWPVLCLFTFYTLVPFAYQRIKKFLHSESRYGTTHFSFDATVGAYYRTYLIGFVVTAIVYVVMFKLFGGPFFASMKHAKTAAPRFADILPFILILYVGIFLVAPLFLTMLQNLEWNGTRLGEHEFQSELKLPNMYFILITNLLGIIVTCGLFIPFAQIRLMKYRIEAMALNTYSSMDEFCADNEPTGSAVGEGVSDLLDFDLSL